MTRVFLERRIAQLRTRVQATRNPQTPQQKRVHTLNCNLLRIAVRQLVAFEANGSVGRWPEFRLERDPCDE